MCFGGGGGGGNSQQVIQQQQDISNQQLQQQQDLSNQQIAAQKQIADQQAQVNQQQFDAQQAQIAQQQQQAQEQAQRQSTYDTGRAQALSEGQAAINDAFSKFSPDYFNQYVNDYMAKINDQISYQQTQAQKDLGFQLARQGLTSSQAAANQQGLIQETAGRTRDEQTANAQQAAANLQSTTAATKENLLNQVAAAQSVGSPIAGNTIEDVNSALQTQRNAISGITSNTGDVTASLSAVPTVNTLSNIFSGVIGAGGSVLGGAATGANNTLLQRALQGQGLAGTTPGAASTTTKSV